MKFKITNHMEAEPDLSSLSRNELEELKRVNSETIEELQRQIGFFRKKINVFGRFAPDPEFEVVETSEGDTNVDQIEQRLQNAIDDRTSKLNETVRLTGVKIVKCNQEISYKHDDQCSKQLSLEIQVHNRTVIMKCILEETLKESSTPSSRDQLKWFEILFEEDIHKEIGDDITRAADHIALHSALSLLKTYVNWQSSRGRVMTAFKESFPQNVSENIDKNGVHTWRIKCDKENRPVFIIVWGRKKVESKFEPDVSLQVEASKEMYDKDSDEILSSASSVFSAMVKTLGLEPALKAFIHLVISDGVTPAEK